MKYKLHPITNLFPPMTEDQFQELKESIREHGQKVPVLMWKGQVIDGAHRARACEELDVEMRSEEWDGQGELTMTVVALNQHRRHLSQDQRAAIAAEIAESLKVEGKKAQSEGGREAGRSRPKKVQPNSAEPIEDPEPAPQSRDKAATAMKVGKTKVSEAMKIKTEAPDLHEKVKAGEMKHAKAKREIQKREKTKQLQAKAEQADEAQKNGQEAKATFELVNVNCLVALDHHKDNGAKFNLIFADPPYNFGYDYGDGKEADSLPAEDYYWWCEEWVQGCVDVLADNGSFWLLTPEEHLRQFMHYLDYEGLHRRAVIVWEETFGNHLANNFARTARYLLYYVKDKNNFVFNVDAPSLRQQSVRQEIGDKRANPEGKLIGRIWKVSRVAGTFSERIPDAPTQVPEEIMTRIIEGCSLPGHVVFDPFTGTGTTGAVAVRNGRHFVGCEKQEKFYKIAHDRMKGEQYGHVT